MKLLIRDSLGKLPKTKTVREDLVEILRIATDKRSHITWEDSCSWLEVKMKGIEIFAKRGLAKLKNSR